MIQLKHTWIRIGGFWVIFTFSIISATNQFYKYGATAVEYFIEFLSQLMINLLYIKILGIFEAVSGVSEIIDKQIDQNN